MKKGVFVVGLLCLVLLSGCSAFNGSGHGSSSVGISSSDKKISVPYQKLSKADKRKVKFDFSAVKVKAEYDITLKIKNESKHAVRFNLAEFKIFSAIDRDIMSDRKGDLVVKPHEACTIEHLFVDINKSSLNDPTNYFIYIDQKNKLSKFTFRIASGTDTKQANELTSTNDNHVTTNVEAPKAALPNNASGSTDSGSDAGDSEASTNSSAPARILTSAAMAKALYLHSMGFTSARGEGVYATPTSYGYKVTDDALQNSTSYFNNSGDELDANGNVIATFSTLAGPTAAAPEGFIYKDSNYSQY